MPIYEYLCAQCKKESEILVFPGDIVECPNCHSKELTRLLSVFSFTSGGTNPVSSGSSSCSTCSSGNCATCR